MSNLFLTNVQKQFNGEKITFSTNGTGATGHPHAESESRYSPYIPHKINSKWIVDLNVKCKTIKILGDRRKSQ